MSNSGETIQYLTPAEISRLFRVIENQRDKAPFLVAYRHGVGVGILLALLPARIVEVRDAYKTLGSVLKLVGLELGYCDRIVKDRQQAVSDILKGLSQSQPVTLPLFNYFPTAAWTALWHLPNVLNDFPIELHAFIAKLYGELDLGNQIVEHATLIAASLPTPTSQIPPSGSARAG